MACYFSLNRSRSYFSDSFYPIFNLSAIEKYEVFERLWLTPGVKRFRNAVGATGGKWCPRTHHSRFHQVASGEVEIEGKRRYFIWEWPEFARWWQLKHVLCSSRKLGEDEPNLTSIFFKGVVKPATRKVW